MRSGPRKLKVDYRKNSYCNTAKLHELDWSEWNTEEAISGGTILRVNTTTSNERHMVRCAHSPTPRLQMYKGTLYWLID